MRILIIDNYDSFTGNLYQLLAAEGHGEPRVVQNDAVTLAEVLDEAPDAIIIAPGPGRPDQRADIGVCHDVIRHVDVPIFGVCLGMQAVAHAFGAQVRHAEHPRHGIPTQVRHDGDDLFAGVESGFEAIRYHSLEVALNEGCPFEPLAWAEDGTLMALRHRERAIWGVQFHPESIGTGAGVQIVRNFLSLVMEMSDSHATERDAAPHADEGAVFNGV